MHCLHGDGLACCMAEGRGTRYQHSSMHLMTQADIAFYLERNTYIHWKINIIKHHNTYRIYAMTPIDQTSTSLSYGCWASTSGAACTQITHITTDRWQLLMEPSLSKYVPMCKWVFSWNMSSVGCMHPMWLPQICAIPLQCVAMPNLVTVAQTVSLW